MIFKGTWSFFWSRTVCTGHWPRKILSYICMFCIVWYSLYLVMMYITVILMYTTNSIWLLQLFIEFSICVKPGEWKVKNCPGILMDSVITLMLVAIAAMMCKTLNLPAYHIKRIYWKIFHGKYFLFLGLLQIFVSVIRKKFIQQSITTKII